VACLTMYLGIRDETGTRFGEHDITLNPEHTLTVLAITTA
jgi:hypothetical protein